MGSLSQQKFYSKAKPLLPRSVLKRLRSFLESPHPLVQSLRSIARYHDEPVLFQFSAKSILMVNSKPTAIGGMGTSFSETSAQIKALGEAAERISLIQNPRMQLTEKSRNLPSAMKLGDLPELYGNTRRLRQMFDRPLPWVHGYSVDMLEQVFLPAQLVFVPYKFTRSEPVIRPPISTGAALGIGYPDAVLRGLLEVIERDAFMLSYYRKEVRWKIDVTGNAGLEQIIFELERCKLALHLLDVSSDTGAYVFLALVIDETGYGPPISAGLKAGYDPCSTALGAIEESLHSRSWIRDIVHTEPNQPCQIRPESIQTLEERAIFWLDRRLTRTLDFYLACDQIKSLARYRSLSESSPRKQLRRQLDSLGRLGATTYFADLTSEGLRRTGFRAVKVLATILQPLHLEEKYFATNGPRLTEDQVVNKVPHFFL